MEKIKVLMVLGNTGMGGSQAFVLNLIQNCDLNRFHFDIAVSYEISNGISDRVKRLGCNVYLLPYFKVYNCFHYVRVWRRFLKEHQYDIVHAHSTNSASVYLRIAKENGCITIAHSHSAGYRGGPHQRFAKRLFAKGVNSAADYWFACSDKAAIRLFGNAYKEYNHYYTIPNAINAEKYLYNADKAKEIRRELGIEDNVLLCGHVGTFSVPKNHLFLLDVFSEVLKYRPDAHLVCCGSGALMPQVKEKALSMGILDKILFTGVVMNVNEYMMAMDVFLFPSLFEGFPVSVIEAEATGMSVVMSDVITKEVDITDLIHRHSLDEPSSLWADTICKTVRGNRTKYNKIIANSQYNMRKSAELVSSLYEKMVHEKKLNIITIK